MILSEKQYQTLYQQATIINRDGHGDKVLKCHDGSYIKLFRIKRRFSSARFYPYCKRFINNAKKLADKDIPTVKVINHYVIPHLKRTAVHYQPLQGVTVDTLLPHCDERLIEQLGVFVGQLHEKGIFFRSIHLSNVVLTPDNKMGLIDICDLRVHHLPLSKTKRQRNFKHLLQYPSEKKILQHYSQSFAKGYATSSPRHGMNQTPLYGHL